MTARRDATRHEPMISAAAVLVGAGVGDSVGLGAGFDDASAEGDAVGDDGAEAWVGEGFGPGAEAFVGGDGQRVLLLPLGEDLEEEFGLAGAAPSPAPTPLSASVSDVFCSANELIALLILPPKEPTPRFRS